MAKFMLFIVEINAKAEWENTFWVFADDFPKVYIPQKDVFFEEVDCPNFEKLQIFIKEKVVSFHEILKNFEIFKVTKNSIATKNKSSNKFELNLIDKKSQNEQLNIISYTTFDKNEITINNQKHKNIQQISL